MGEYWIDPVNNASVYYNRYFNIQQPRDSTLSKWFDGSFKGNIIDVVTKDGIQKYFKIIEVTRSRGRSVVNADKFKYIPCEELVSCKTITWDYFKGQSDRKTMFNGRALVGRTVVKKGPTGTDQQFEGTITECREVDDGKYVYTIEYSARTKPSEHWEERSVMEYLCI